VVYRVRSISQKNEDRLTYSVVSVSVYLVVTGHSVTSHLERMIISTNMPPKIHPEEP